MRCDAKRYPDVDHHATSQGEKSYSYGRRSVLIVSERANSFSLFLDLDTGTKDFITRLMSASSLGGMHCTKEDYQRGPHGHSEDEHGTFSLTLWVDDFAFCHCMRASDLDLRLGMDYPPRRVHAFTIIWNDSTQLSLLDF